jgi:two-component system response regulator HydG
MSRGTTKGLTDAQVRVDGAETARPFADRPAMMTSTLLQPHDIAVPTLSLTPCIVDDDQQQLNDLTAVIVGMGYAPIATRDPNEALALVKYGRCRLVLVAAHMPEMSGYEFLDQALRSNPGAHVILTAGEYTLESALEAIRRGAADFLPRPLDRAHLKKTLDDVDAVYYQNRRARELEEQLLDVVEFHGIIGKSLVMLEMFDFARKIARHYSNVLLLGATGSGKELLARAIHQISPVAEQKLVVCNCSAMVDTLLESQLFGHVRGAFTGASESRTGFFEYADGGTVFLDEIGDTSLAMQARLLRVIQNREVQRVGSPEVRHINIRLIAATNRNLRADVLAGRFREDLFYRLNPIQIRIPPLSQRLEDIPLLTQFFLKKYNEEYGKDIVSLTPRAQKALLRHPWPGNVRELENVISSACVTAAGEVIDLVDLPENLQQSTDHSLEGEDWKPSLLDDVCEQHIRRVFELCEGNLKRTSQILGIGRSTLYRHAKEFGLDKGTNNRSKGATA